MFSKDVLQEMLGMAVYFELYLFLSNTKTKNFYRSNCNRSKHSLSAL